MKFKTSRKSGFTLVEIMIVVAIIGMLAAIAIPNFVKAREVSRTNACINNLRIIDGAKEQWAMEHKANTGDTADTTTLWEYVKGNAEPVCPANGTYTVGTIGTLPSCNINGHALPGSNTTASNSNG